MKKLSLTHHSSIGFAAALILGAATSATSQAENWPNFRGRPDNTGTVGETIKLPLVEKWHSTAPEVEENGAVVANGVAYMCTDDGHLFAFDVATGFTKPGFPVNVTSSFAAPAVDPANDRVYVLAGNTLFGFRLDGTVPPGFPVVVGGAGLNYNQGPVIEDGFVYLNAGANVQKFNSSGVQQWSTPTGANQSQPAVSGDFVYNYTGSQVQKYNKLTGAAVIGGGFPINTGGGQASLAVVNGRIFVKADQLYAYNASTGALLWSNPDGGSCTYYDSPTVANGAVYVYGCDAKVYAFNEATGAAIPGFPSAALSTPFDRNWSSPAVANDKLFVGAGTSQKLVVLGASGHASAGQVLDDYPTFSTDPQGFDLCSVVISDGYVFGMLDGGGLYCFFGGQGNPPAGALKINDDAACTQDRNVILSLSNNNNPDVTEMIISEDPFFTGASFQPYAATSPFMLSAGLGLKTVYAQLKTSGGDVSNVFTDQIELAEVCDRCGDFNDDGKVDAADRAIIQGAIRKHTGDAGFVAEADYDGDGTITTNDYREWYKCYKAYLAATSAN